MISFDFYFIIVTALSSITALAIIIATRKIQYNGVGTDNQIMANIASQVRLLGWPSQIHKTEFKSLMKDTTILLIAVFQRLLRNKKTDHPYIVLNCVSNVVSAIFIYLIAKEYFSAEIAFFASTLFTTYVFAWLAVIQVGHTTVANAFFLLSVFSTLQIPHNPFAWTIVTGVLFALCMFSSPSARKYILLFFAALFFSIYKSMLYEGQFLLILGNLWADTMIIVNISLILFIFFIILLLRFGYKKVVTDMYCQKSFSRLNKIIVSRDKFSLEHYLNHAKKKIHSIIKKIITYGIVILFALNFIGFIYLSFILLGFAIIVILLMAPEIKKNISGYIFYAMEGRAKNRYRMYPIMYARAGKPLPFPVKRPGWIWIWRYFLKTAPFQAYSFIGSFVYIIISSFFSTKPLEQILIGCAICATSLLPIFYGELTKAVQVGRSYLPCLVGLIIFIAYSFQKLFEYSHLYFWIFALLILSGALFHGLWKYLTDILPVRMCSTFLLKKLNELGIKEFYTYDMAYNNVFINNIDPEILSKYTIHRIKNLSEVHNGWVVIPGTSSKALNMESEFEELLQGDFSRDSLLNKLLETKEIAKIAECNFKTPGTSDMWVQESEITSYRDLIIHDITEKDRFRGYAWLVNTSKIKNVI